MATTEGIGGFLSVSVAAPSTFDEAGYAALTWTDIVENAEIPEYGAEHATVTFTRLKDGIVNKYHGELNYGALPLPLAFDPADAGQAILKAARESKDEIYFRETISDGSVIYFAGKVMSFKIGGASVGSVKPAMANVEITRATVEVAA